MRYFAVVLISLLYITLSKGQGFDKGALNIEPGIGIGYFSATSSEANKTRAVANLYPVKITYGFYKRVGITGIFQYNQFREDPFQLSNMNSINAGLGPVFNFVSAKNTILYANFLLGYSRLRFHHWEQGDLRAHGTSFHSNIGIRQLLTPRLGIFASGGYGGYNYAYREEKTEVPIIFSGLQLKTGLAFSF
jgi:hypothetical protein